MSKYELSLLQEILMEKGAGVLGDLFRYERSNQITDHSHPVFVMHDLVWGAKQDILAAKTETDLAQIEGQFQMATQFLDRVTGVAHV